MEHDKKKMGLPGDPPGYSLGFWHLWCQSPVGKFPRSQWQWTYSVFSRSYTPPTRTASCPWAAHTCKKSFCKPWPGTSWQGLPLPPPSNALFPLKFSIFFPGILLPPWDSCLKLSLLHLWLSAFAYKLLRHPPKFTAQQEQQRCSQASLNLIFLQLEAVFFNI